MDPNATKEMQHIVDSLILRARQQGPRYKAFTTTCIVPTGTPTLPYLARKLDLAMLGTEPNVCLALGMAIIDIWGANKGNPAVEKSKEKILNLLRSRPAVDPAIKMVRLELRKEANKPESRHASHFLAGPIKPSACLEAAQARRLPLLRN